jgi:transketolase
MELNAEKLQALQDTAVKIRETIIETLVEAGSGHSAGPLGMADVFTAFYFHILNHDPKRPDWPDRDRLVLSNGHICPVCYVAMAYAGYFPMEELKTLRKLNSLPGRWVPGSARPSAWPSPRAWIMPNTAYIA